MNRFGEEGLTSHDLEELLLLLEHEMPVPVDLATRLLELGIDVSELTEHYIEHDYD